ncbi:hypothetical protein PABG_06520 [Paracoccidioides brasiliensis Pb03]|nr:hypothetical protein PABG_06520 [Paracoccidioides brasiliensis Pb03]
MNPLINEDDMMVTDGMSLAGYSKFMNVALQFPPTGKLPSAPKSNDVQKVLHTQPTDYMLCSMQYKFFPGGDKSPPSGLGPLPNVIEKTNNTRISHGALDFLLFLIGTLITIQNMTWNGAQGFQEAPSEKLYVPYHPGLGEIASRNVTGPFTQVAGAGQLGTVHTERGSLSICQGTVSHKLIQISDVKWLLANRFHDKDSPVFP